MIGSAAGMMLGILRTRMLTVIVGFGLMSVVFACGDVALAVPPEQLGAKAFGIYSFQVSPFANEAETELATVAGSHPYAMTTNIEFDHELVSEEEYVYGANKHSGAFFDEVQIYGDPKDVVANLPRGMVIDPAATPVKCSEAAWGLSRDTPALPPLQWAL